jgi:hypothetical protein
MEKGEQEREESRGPYLSGLAEVEEVAMTSVYGVVVWRRGSGTFRCWQCHPRARTGLGWWGGGSGSEPRTLCPASHLLFMALCDEGPPAIYGLGTPDQGAG